MLALLFNFAAGFPSCFCLNTQMQPSWCQLCWQLWSEIWSFFRWRVETYWCAQQIIWIIFLYFIILYLVISETHPCAQQIIWFTIVSFFSLSPARPKILNHVFVQIHWWYFLPNSLWQIQMRNIFESGEVLRVSIRTTVIASGKKSWLLFQVLLEGWRYDVDGVEGWRYDRINEYLDEQMAAGIH